MRTADRWVVTPLQLRMMRIVARTNAEYGVPDLRLEGGTALAAYHLSHRESEDLGFFANPAINAREFGYAVGQHAEREGVSLQPVGPASLGYAQFLAREPSGGSTVRLDFAAASPFQLEPREPTAEGIEIASYRDLCAGKLHAICDRFAERDFVDLHAILHRVEGGTVSSEPTVRLRFRSLVRDTCAIDPGLSPHLVGQAISRGLDRAIVQSLPLRLLSPVTDEQVQAILHLCVDECARLTVEALGPLRNHRGDPGREVPSPPPKADER